MAEAKKKVEDMGSYSSEVGEWTTGSGGGAGSERTSIRPEGKETDEEPTDDERLTNSINNEVDTATRNG